MYSYRIYILIGVLCIYQLCCVGKEHSFSKLSIENGLSNNQVNTIFKDSNGFIWIGTLDGIDRYDGVEIKSYLYKFSEAIENVQAINEDLFKNLWVGTSTGLFRYNRKVDSFERVNIDAKYANIQALAMLPDSNLCVGTANGLYVINTSSIQAEKILLNSLPENQNISITGLFPANDGSCWITTSNGLVKYSFLDQKSEWFQCMSKPQAAYNSFTSICSIGNKLYLGTTNVGIVEFDLSKKMFSEGVSVDNNIILNIASDHKELIFAGTNGGGLKVINIRTREVKNLVAQPNDPESLSSNSVYAFLLDKEGRYWIGTYSAGLCFSKHITGNFKLHHLASDYPDINKSIRSFYFSPDGSEYFGTRNGFAQLSKNGKFNFFQSSSTLQTGLRSNIILSIYPFMDDVLIGTYGGGVSRFSIAEQKIKPFLGNDILFKGNIYAFDTDNFGDLWITSFNGLYRYSAKDQSLVNFNTQNSELKNNQIFEITFDSKGRIWVGSMSGTYVYNYEERKLKSIDLSVISNNTFKTNYIYEDQNGSIWICTERGGLIMVDSALTQSTSYHEENGLPDNSVCAIIQGNSGEYWISTLKGLCKYSSQTQKFTKYSVSEGLPSLAFTPASTYLAPDGNLFLGNEKGLVYFNPDDINGTSFSSKIIITDFYISGKVVKPGEDSALKQIIEETHEIRLNNQMNNIGFRFVNLNYINAADNSYQYKLEGFDENWRDNGSKNTVFYQDIQPGNYIFKVRNTNGAEAGPSSDENAEVKIVIYQPFLNSLYFYALLFSFIIAVIFIVVRYIKMLPRRIKQKIDLSKKLEKYKGNRVPQDRGELIINELKQRMTENKLYLNPGLKLADLARDINYPVNEISQVLNQDLNQSFSDFVNKYRVEEVKELMSHGEHEKFTLVAIAKKCGFNSKTSFYRVFKKETGKTPAEYLKELNSTLSN